MAILKLFEGFGVELEFMIVDRKNLKVKPVADELLKALSGKYLDEVPNGKISWSNELALHVIEFKTNGPARSLEGLAAAFYEQVQQANTLLAPFGACLMPTAMHPEMDPFTEMKLWPHEKNDIYEKYNEIFDCRGHGWANLQSTHINLPFGDDEEFGRLHAAIRLIMPLVPALAASSPLKDGKQTGYTDSRLEVYRGNQKKIPSIAGSVIPEQVFTEQAYRDIILAQNYRDIAPYDPEGILQEEWLNSRGAIARFQRNAIEIRIIDVQECPLADLAILELIVAAIKQLVAEENVNYESQKNWTVPNLYDIYQKTVKDGSNAYVNNIDYLAIWDIKSPDTAKKCWQHIATRITLSAETRTYLEIYFSEGNLSERILHRLNNKVAAQSIHQVYSSLAQSLAKNEIFRS